MLLAIVKSQDFFTTALLQRMPIDVPEDSYRRVYRVPRPEAQSARLDTNCELMLG